MPLYVYRCSCGVTLEVSSTLNERPSEIPCVCGEAAKRIPTAASVAFKGPGWAKDGYAK